MHVAQHRRCRIRMKRAEAAPHIRNKDTNTNPNGLSSATSSPVTSTINVTDTTSTTNSTITTNYSIPTNSPKCKQRHCLDVPIQASHPQSPNVPNMIVSLEKITASARGTPQHMHSFFLPSSPTLILSPHPHAARDGAQPGTLSVPAIHVSDEKTMVLSCTLTTLSPSLSLWT